MSKYVLLDDVREMLRSLNADERMKLAIDGDSAIWDNGWNKAVDAAINELKHLPTVDMTESQFLKPCPFCGNQEIKSRYYNAGVGEYRIEIGCKACDYHMITTCYTKNECVSLGEIIKLSNKAIVKWNRRYNESAEDSKEGE